MEPTRRELLMRLRRDGARRAVVSPSPARRDDALAFIEKTSPRRHAIEPQPRCPVFLTTHCPHGYRDRHAHDRKRSRQRARVRAREPDLEVVGFNFVLKAAFRASRHAFAGRNSSSPSPR
jgi:hypothetical protein